MNRREHLQSLGALGLLPLASADFISLNEEMTKRPIPSTGEMLPVIGVGTWETFDVDASMKEEMNELRGVLKTLTDKGGSVIDSSPMYGSAEKNVGTLSSELGLNKKLFIATKVWTNGKENGIKQMNTSLSLMQRKTIDLMQIHNLVDWRVHLKTLREWKEQGKFRYIGITHYREESYKDLEQIINTEPIDFLQVNYNLLNRQSGNRLLPLARDKKVAVIISQPFAYGRLFEQTKGKKLPEWAHEFDCHSWAQFFLKFIISHPAVTCAIPGTGNAGHMLDNVTAGFGKLPDEKQREMMVKAV